MPDLPDDQKTNQPPVYPLNDTLKNRFPGDSNPPFKSPSSEADNQSQPFLGADENKTPPTDSFNPDLTKPDLVEKEASEPSFPSGSLPVEPLKTEEEKSFGLDSKPLESPSSTFSSSDPSTGPLPSDPGLTPSSPQPQLETSFSGGAFEGDAAKKEALSSAETRPLGETSPLREDLSLESSPGEGLGSVLPESGRMGEPEPSLSTEPVSTDNPPVPSLTEPELPQTGKKSSSLIKKLLLIFLVLLFLGGVGFGVYKFVLPQLKKTQGVTLTYWGLWEPEGVLSEVLKDWEEQNPTIKINYEQHSPKEYRERLQSSLARSEGPDIFRFHNTWVPMFQTELDPVPALVMNASGFEQAYYPVASSSLRSGANYLGVPLEIDTLALYYNQDIFTTAGVSPPETWDELRQLASQLTLKDKNGRIERAGVALGTTGNIWHWSDILGLMMLQNGADLSDPTDKLAADALTFYTLFANTDQVWDETLPSSIHAFASGKTAMVFGFSWAAFEIKEINPELNFKIVPAPQLVGSDVAWASFWAEGVAKNSPNREAAWEFIKFFSSEETMQKLYQSQSRVRLFGEPYSRVGMARLLEDDSNVIPFLNQAPQSESWYLCSRTFDNGINDRMIKYFEDAVNAVNRGTTPGAALTTAAAGVSQVLSQYGL